MTSKRLMLKAAKRRAQILRHASRVVMEALENRILLSTTLPNPVVPITLPIETLPLQPVTGTPLTLSPEMIDHAFGFGSIGFQDAAGNIVRGDGTGQTIAIVEPFGSSTIESDLEAFDAEPFGNPSWSISNNDGTGHFCLTIRPLGGAGVTPAPIVISGAPTDTMDWAAAETSLDVEWIHAVAPGAHILLVEAPSTNMLDLLDSVVYAASQPGVSTVCMTWGTDLTGNTFTPPATGTAPFPAPAWLLDGFMVTPAGHQGVTFLASSGDDGNQQYPAASYDVLSVGGSTLSFGIDGTDLGGVPWNETFNVNGVPVTESTGGGADGLYTDHHNFPMVVLNSDPADGVWIYDSNPVPSSVPGAANNANAPWYVVGGTEFACAAWSGLISIIDQGIQLRGGDSLADGEAIDEILYLGELNTNDFPPMFYGGTLPTFPLWPTGAPPNGGPTIANLFKNIPTNGNTGVGVPITLNLVSDMVDNSLGFGAGGVVQLNSATGVTVLDTDFTNRLVFTQQPTDVTAGVPMQPVKVEIEDAGGNNTLSDASVTLQISALSSSGSATLLGTTSLPAANGVATFSDLSIDKATKPGFTYELKATSFETLPADSSDFTVSAATATASTQLLPSTQTIGDTWQYGVVPSFSFSVQDAFGNPISNNSSCVTVSVASGPNTQIQGTTTVTMADGIATFNDLSFSEAGSYVLAATSPGYSAATGSLQVVAIPVFEHFTFNGFVLGATILALQQTRNAPLIAAQGPPTVMTSDVVLASAGSAVAANVFYSPTDSVGKLLGFGSSATDNSNTNDVAGAVLSGT